MKSNRPTPSLPSELGSSTAGTRSPPSPHDARSVSGEAPGLGGSAKPGSHAAPEERTDMETSIVVEELTHRLPTSELVKIIKGALECGKRNRPFTETDLLRAMTFGASSTYVRAPRSAAERGTRTRR